MALVIADHAGARWLQGGFIGVDVFFVVSGYLITQLLLREVEKVGRLNVGRFYARRALRILPAAALVLTVTLAYATSQMSLTRVQQLADDATWSSFFLANVHFADIGTDYFKQGQAQSPFQHYWSLAVEEQFYLLWPLVVATVVAVHLVRGRPLEHLRRDLAVVLGVVVVASLTWSVWESAHTPVTAYFSTSARAWEIGVGALLAVWRPEVGRVAATALGVVGVVAVAGAALMLDHGSQLPGWRALVPVLGAAAILAAGTSPVAKVLGLSALVWVGDLSYALYLWHWPVLLLGSGEAPVLVLLTLTLLLSVASYYLVENPVRHGRLLRPGRRGLVLWPIAVGSVLVAAIVAERHSADLLQDRMAGPDAPLTAPRGPSLGGSSEGESVGAVTSTLDERLALALGAADNGQPVPFPLTNLPTPATHTHALSIGCLAMPEETSTSVCPAGKVGARRTVVLLGDSQAGQWVPALHALGVRQRFQVVPLVKLGCPPFDIPVVDGSGADFWQCTEFRAWASGYIEKLDPDVIVVGSEATSYRNRPAPGLGMPETWQRGVTALVDDLQAIGASVVVVADTPDLSFEPADCLTAPGARLDDCVGTPHDGLTRANAETRAAAVSAGAGWIDALALLCVRDRCPTVVDRTMTFIDYSHVSPAWSAALADDLGFALEAALHDAQT